MLFVEESNPFVTRSGILPYPSHLPHIAASNTPKPVQTSFSGRAYSVRPFFLVALQFTIALCYFVLIKREREREREREIGV
jgi:hypothetical protein